MRENDSNVMPKIVIGGIAKPNEVEEFYKYLETEGEKKKFDNYIIAYIDFLGIKEKMKNESSYESLQILKFLLMGTKRTASYISDINTINDFEIKIFSDNIVIAQKVEEERVNDQIISIAYKVHHRRIQFPAFGIPPVLLCKNWLDTVQCHVCECW